jgi:hypothetical protein
MAKRRYKGCELTSPLYRKVAAEMARNKNIIKDQPYKLKINGK